VPSPVQYIPTSSPSACPCQGAIDELQSEISVLQAAIAQTPLSSVTAVESAGSSDSAQSDSDSNDDGDDDDEDSDSNDDGDDDDEDHDDDDDI